MPRNVWESLWITEAFGLNRILRGREYGEASREKEKEKYEVLVCLTSL